MFAQDYNQSHRSLMTQSSYMPGGSDEKHLISIVRGGFFKLGAVSFPKAQGKLLNFRTF